MQAKRYSITWSAIDSMSCETLRPIALAVLRLITKAVPGRFESGGFPDG